VWSIYDRAPSGLAVVNERFEFVRVNPGMATLLGQTVHYILGKTLRDLVPQTTAEYANHERKLGRNCCNVTMDRVLEGLFRAVAETKEGVVEHEAEVELTGSMTRHVVSVA
jgi:PAS domain S-box-containing protein